MFKRGFAIISFLISTAGAAQFFEDFENGIPGNMSEEFLQGTLSWNNNCLFNSRDRSGGAPCPISGSSSASFWGSAIGDSTILRTPILDLSNNSYRLEFQHVQRELSYFLGYNNSLFVEISVDGGSNWIIMELFDYDIPHPIIQSIDLLSFGPTSQTIIRFRGLINLGSAIIIDNISIAPIPDNDAKLQDITVSSITTDTEFDITGTIKNHGLDPINSFDLNWHSDNGNALHTQEFSNLNLTAGNLYYFMHETPYQGIPGLDYIKVWVTNINGLGDDDNPSNNVITKKVNIASNEVPKQRALYEQFTSSTCPPCFNFNENYFNADFINPNSDNISLIKYQMNWPAPGDPYYTEEGGVRKDYYGVYGVPELRLENKVGTYFDVMRLQDELDAVLLRPTYFSINASHNLSYNGTIDLEVNILPYIGDTFNVHVAVVEKETVNNATSNGEVSFNNVMLKMLPDAEGTLLTFHPNELQTLNFQADLSQTFMEEIDDLEVVVFIQSIDHLKTVMQSEISTLGVLGIPTNVLNDVNIYPNPSVGKLGIGSSEPLTVSIFDLLGKMVFTSEGVTNQTDLDISNLQSGSYFVELSNSLNSEIKKLIVQQ